MRKMLILVIVVVFAASPVFAQPNIESATSEVDRPYEQEAEDALYTEPTPPVIESAEEEAKQKGDSTVVLTDAGDRKLKVISIVRSVKKCSLKEAKKIVETVPSIVVDNVTADEARIVKNRLEQVGAYAEIE